MPDRRIADLSKNGRDTIRVSISEFRGAQFLDIRNFVVNRDAELVPTPKGVTIRPGLIRAAIDALTEAERVLIADGTIKREGSK